MNLIINNPDYIITINGSDYDVRLDEHEALVQAAEFAAKYSDISKLQTADEAAAAKKELNEFVEKIIGEGSVKKILGGKEPKLAFLVKLLLELNNYFAKVNAQYMAQEYGE